MTLPDLGPHAAFILASYAAVTAVVAAMIVWLFAERARWQRQLKALEDRGVRRRSGARPSES